MFDRIVERIFPTRATTQTWMILTLLLVVGIAVAAVGLYITFVLRSEVQIAYQQTMLQQTVRVAELVESEPDPARRLALVETMTRFGELRITIMQDASVLDVERGALVHEGALERHPEMRFPDGVEVNYAQRREDERLIYYTAVRRAASGMIVRVAQPRPMLFGLIGRLQFTLIVAMVMALLLAVFGSWIAAQRVTEPLVAIRNSAKAISEGKLDEEIYVDSRAAE